MLCKNKMSDPTFGKCAIAPWQPPKEVFITAWSFLYVFYGITLYRARKTPAASSLWLGLLFNLLWDPIFRYNSKLGLGIIAIMIVIALDSYSKLKNSNLHYEARFIQVYIGWLIFASTLNGYITLKCKN